MKNVLGRRTTEMNTIKNLQQELYPKQDGEVKRVEISVTPTLVESIYNNVKLLFGNQVKEFKSVDEAEQWAESNGVKIKVYHKAGSFVGDNMKEKNNHRDDSARYKESMQF
jgi:hypothetical protein